MNSFLLFGHGFIIGIITITKTPSQLMKIEFNLLQGFRELESVVTEGLRAHILTQRERANREWVSLLKLQRLFPVKHLLQQGHTCYILPKHFHQLGTIVQIYESMGAILMQKPPTGNYSSCFSNPCAGKVGGHQHLWLSVEFPGGDRGLLLWGLQSKWTHIWAVLLRQKKVLGLRNNNYL